jgi:nucleotide-binding universal stress UspA family protein
MIKDVMVWLDGGIFDDIRLATAAEISNRFESQVVGLFVNPLPWPGPVDGNPLATTELTNQARRAGDLTEALLAGRLRQLGRPVEIRRFDVLANDVANVAAREARSADTFVALRPNGVMDPDRLIEGVLFGSGRHLFLIPEDDRPKIAFDRIVVAWNGSREAARALAEAMPFLYEAKEVAVVFVAEEWPDDEVPTVGVDAIKHLRHHGIDALHHPVRRGDDDVGTRLIQEARQFRADLLVMGGYGHSRLREWMLGGVTYSLIHEAPVPLVIAH